MSRPISVKDKVWLVYERPIIETVRKYYPSFWNYLHDDPMDLTQYETHREKVDRKVAEENVRTQVPGSFYRNFRIEE
jgi:hypothetical protein